LFRQLPAIFSGDLTHDPLQIKQRQMTWFWSCETRGKTLMHVLQVQTPSSHFLRRWSDVIRCALVVMLHALLFFDVIASSELFCLAYRVPHLLEYFMRLFYEVISLKSATVVSLALPDPFLVVAAGRTVLRFEDRGHLNRMFKALPTRQKEDH
jgi:hypothetical protein